MNFYTISTIRSEIEKFKSSKNFKEEDYQQILKDFDYLYNSSNNSLFQIKSNEYILEEKENFRKYLIGSLLQNINKEAKKKNFRIALENIKKLEKLKPSEKEQKDIYKIKQFCEISINYNDGEILIGREQYRQAINFYKNLKANSNTVIENDAYSKALELSKAKYITWISNKIINLLPKTKDKKTIENCQKIIKHCEALFKEFQFDNKLKSKISEIKKNYYSRALETIIEQKIEENMTFSDEIDKYKSLVDTENLKDNKLEEFYLKTRKLEEPKSLKNEKQIILNNDNKINYEFNYISLETINNYLNIIKYINEAELDPNIEKDIITQVNNYNEELNICQDDLFKDWILKNKQSIKNNNFRGNIFAFFYVINKRITGFDIRPIQLISLLFLTKNKPKLGGIFLQINTGEGKSLIIQFLAAYLALLGNKVDIISSSSILADRDAEDENIINFYLNLGLTSGSASKDEYDKIIVYGDTQNFEAAILREEFREKKIRKNRPFDCVIIDEVDSISLDNIITMTQLTDNFPGRSSFFFFYYQILICYCQIINELPEITGHPKEYFYQHPEEFKEIIHKNIKKMFKGKILEEDGTLKTDTPIIFPKCMKKNIEDSLDTWISNVIKAPTMIENRDFIIKNNIIPVDYSNTGVLQNNMVWDGGLQQILQIIHNTKATFENENTNFLSNISFFKRYNGNIYGVTGTFGGSNFQYILKKVYEINLCKIPPNKTSLLEDWGSFVFTDENTYIMKILDNIKTVVVEKKRSVLLISNSIVKGKQFYDILVKEYKENVMQYFTDDDKKTIEKILDEQKIIVATNIAGRGTDIKISEKLERNGGLHVIVTFLPINQRIEDQNYGRAGRKGQKGSHILIMLYKDEFGHLEKDQLNVDNIKKIRDQIELKSIDSLIQNEMKKILEKEELFKDFCFFLTNSCRQCNNFQKSNIEEKWGILLKNKDLTEIKEKYNKLKTEDKMIFQNNLIKLKEIINNSDSTKTFYTEIFNLEPDYSWAAKIRYNCMLAKEKQKLINKAFMKFKRQNEAIQDLQKIKEKIDMFIGDLSSQSSLNKLAFSFFEKNKEKIKDNNFQTEIEKQNCVRKNFLEAIKSLIDNNIETIQTFINENKNDNTIETDKLLTIEDIIKTTTNLSLDNKSDIKTYMNEFGFITFEVLIIKKKKFFIGNLIVIAIGVLEFCLGAVLLTYSANPLIFRFASYLIREGIKDIVKGVKACIDGEEINLKSYAIDKGISLVGFALELVIGPAPSVGSTVKDRFISSVKGQCINLVKSYGNRYIANKIVKNLIVVMSGKIKEWLTFNEYGKVKWGKHR